jgi:HAD superfamily hydrolase (TIGR01459 family)
MTNTHFPRGLADIASQYDIILCDVWGVIHNGRRAFDEACDALTRFRTERGGRVCLITNAPVPKAQVIRHFMPLGVPSSAFDECVSSGDATRAELERQHGTRVWRFGADEGWEHDRFLYEGLDLQFTDGSQAELLLCIGMRDQVNDQPEDYRKELKPYANSGLPMLCANPDKQVRIGGKLYWCAGAIADIYEQEGGKVIYPGKPWPPIYALALARVAAQTINPTRVLCIGDSPSTDIRGARLQGHHSLYVGTGLKEHGPDFRLEAIDHLKLAGEQATYAMPALCW